MSDVIAGMNGTLWIFAALLIGMVVVQALIFLRAALRFNKRNNLVTGEELKSAARSGTISVIGPAISNIVVALSLISMVGPAVSFMRCGVIGSPSWELFMADLSAQVAGVEFNSPEFTGAFFVLCIFGMTLASAPYFITTIIALKPLDVAIEKNKTKKDNKGSFIADLGNAAMVALLGYLIVDYLKTPAQILAVVVAGGVSYLLLKVIAKTGKKWLGDWIMAIAMAVGMAAAQFAVSLGL